MKLIFVLSLVVIAAAVFAIIRKVDVRLALLFAALALATLAGIASAPDDARSVIGVLATVAGNLAALVRTLLKTLSDEQFVVPICCAMGFAHVLLLTGCDQHLVHLLDSAATTGSFLPDPRGGAGGVPRKSPGDQRARP